MSVDLRRFVFPLEPLQRKHEWRRDATQARLAAAERAVVRLRGELETLEDARQRTARDCASAALRRLDPAQQRHGLAFLADLLERAGHKKALLAKSEHAREALRRECLECQRQVELVGELRETQLEVYRREELFRQETEADRDWTARRQWKSAATPIANREEIRS
jgi:hypothetical protein